MERKDKSQKVAEKVVTPYDALTYRIIGLAMAVHRELGPGLPEKIYHTALTIALTDEQISFEQEYPVRVMFRGKPAGKFELDAVVERTVVVELKAVEAFAPVHIQQVVAYLAASGLPVGLLINFGAERLQYKRLFPPKSVQASPAFQNRHP